MFNIEGLIKHSEPTLFDIKSLIKEDVLEFLQKVAVKTKGYDVYLGGGYLRDNYFQEYINKGNILTQPKDLDIFFIPNNETSFCELPAIEKTYINYDIDARDIPNVRPNIKHVRGLFNAYLSTRDIQFIVYDKPLTMQQLAEDMDCNLNQIMYNVKTGVGYHTGAFYSGFEDKEIEMLHEFEVERMFGRIQRMMKKFPSFTVTHNIPLLEWGRMCYEMEADKLSGKRKRLRAEGSFIDDKVGNL